MMFTKEMKQLKSVKSAAIAGNELSGDIRFSVFQSLFFRVKG